jgi:hypothetical protein
MVASKCKAKRARRCRRVKSKSRSGAKKKRMGQGALKWRTLVMAVWRNKMGSKQKFKDAMKMAKKFKARYDNHFKCGVPSQPEVDCWIKGVKAGSRSRSRSCSR